MFVRWAIVAAGLAFACAFAKSAMAQMVDRQPDQVLSPPEAGESQRPNDLSGSPSDDEDAPATSPTTAAQGRASSADQTNTPPPALPGSPSTSDSSNLALADLTLAELLSMEVQGSPVRPLHLSLVPVTDNPLGLSVVEMPASVEVIGRRTIVGRGIENVVQGTQNLVGVVYGDSPSDPYTFGMRGFAKDSVIVLYDGVSMGTTSLNMRPLSTFNVERIELVKGPGVMHHGQGGAAGTVNIVPRAPSPERGHTRTISTAFGSYDQVNLGFEVDGPLSDEFFFHTSVSHSGRGGWVEDTPSEATDAHLALLYRPTPDLRLTLSATYFRDDLPAYWGTPLIAESAAQSPDYDAVKTDDGRVLDRALRFKNYNVADNEISSRSQWYRAKLQWSVGPGIDQEFLVYYFDAERDWRNAESYVYNDVTGLIERDRLLVTHDRRLIGGAWTTRYEHSLWGMTNRVAFTARAASNDFKRQIGFDTSGTDFVDAVDLRSPETGNFGPVDSRRDRNHVVETALSLTDRLDLTDALHLSIAGKQEWITMDRRRYAFDGTPRSGTFDRTFSLQTMGITSGYRFGPWLSVFAHATRAHDHLGGDLTQGFVANLDEFGPSVVWGQEVGAKSSLLGGALDLTLAGYQAAKHIRAQLDAARAPTAERRVSRGVEFATTVTLPWHVRVGGNLAYNRVTLSDGYVADGGPTGGAPINSPRLNVHGWITFDQLFGFPIQLGMSARHVSSSYLDYANTVELGAYTLLDFMAAYTGDQYRIAAHVRNATDELYVPWAVDYLHSQVQLGPPRTFELTARASF